MINYKSKKRDGENMKKRTRKIFAWGMLIAMVASVIAGILAYAIK